MKQWTLASVFVFAIGCSGAKEPPSVTDAGNSNAVKQPKVDSSMPKEAEKFGDDVFVVPPYPGAEHMPYTGIEMDAEKGHTYARHYSTPDDLDKVETFIKTEGGKLGKYSDPTKGVFNEKLIRNGIIELTGDKKFIFKLMRDEKGNKTDIMYNITVPKK